MESHYSTECPNYVKKESKNYYSILSDDDSDEEEEEGVIPNDDEGELTEEELMGNYQMLFVKWSKPTQAYTTREIKHSNLVQKNHELTKLVEEQRVEICILEEKIWAMIKEIKIMNSSTEVLDEILLQGTRSGDNIGI
ncbi:hypothetical protein LIER_31984 [Lithospermum erythrorhizon]|uniref:Uncharacterized protein n=1 Tax=Lithospermum erythrorhizon TaxID=34254 RepID=A0AAV3RXY0_LITER